MNISLDKHPSLFSGELIGFEYIGDILFKLVQKGSLPQTMILNGPKSIGKSIFSFKLARHILAKTEAEVAMVDKMHHPDFIFCDPYFGINTIEEKSKDSVIKIDDLRKIIAFSFTKPILSDKKVIIINDINKVDKNSINTILKLVEEPQKNLHIIMISHNIRILAKTITSRCSIYHCKPLEFSAYKRIVGRFCNNISDDKLHCLYHVLGCNISDTLKLIQSNLFDKIDSMPTIIQNIHDTQNISKVEISAIIYSWLYRIKHSRNDSNIADRHRRAIFLKELSAFDECLKFYEAIQSGSSLDYNSVSQYIAGQAAAAMAQ